jgi:SAM-dependent methyltransferase
LRNDDTGFWGDVCRLWRAEQPHTLWRAHSDALNVALFSRWLRGDGVERLLKTDLFDEMACAGLRPLLEERARLVVGIDLSGEVVCGARVRYPDQAGAVADVRCLPFADASFDAIVSNSTLDHFAETDHITVALAELFRALREGGRLLLTLDNGVNPAVALRNALPFGVTSRLGLVPYRMGKTYGPAGLRRALCATGFEVEEVVSILHCPRAPAVVLAGLVERHGDRRAKAALLKTLTAFELLAEWPTRFLTGYFVAIRAQKPAAGHPAQAPCDRSS